jgi:hypothetical protein
VPLGLLAWFRSLGLLRRHEEEQPRQLAAQPSKYSVASSFARRSSILTSLLFSALLVTPNRTGYFGSRYRVPYRCDSICLRSGAYAGCYLRMLPKDDSRALAAETGACEVFENPPSAAGGDKSATGTTSKPPSSKGPPIQLTSKACPARKRGPPPDAVLGPRLLKTKFTPTCPCGCGQGRGNIVLMNDAEEAEEHMLRCCCTGCGPVHVSGSRRCSRTIWPLFYMLRMGYCDECVSAAHASPASHDTSTTRSQTSRKHVNTPQLFVLPMAPQALLEHSPPAYGDRVPLFPVVRAQPLLNNEYAAAPAATFWLHLSFWCDWLWSQTDVETARRHLSKFGFLVSRLLPTFLDVWVPDLHASPGPHVHLSFGALDPDSLCGHACGAHLLRMGGRSHTSAAPRRDCCTFWP